jgi:hypothetical protein
VRSNVWSEEDGQEGELDDLLLANFLDAIGHDVGHLDLLEKFCAWKTSLTVSLGRHPLRSFISRRIEL